MQPKFRLLIASGNKTLRISLLSIFLLLLPNYSFARSYMVAIVPQLPEQITSKNWGPLIFQLSKQTQLDLHLRLYSNFKEFESAFTQGIPDFVYLNPYHQLVANKKQGYIPLVRDGTTELTGILVVKKDSPIKTIQELNGKKVAFPSLLAFGASLYMRASLSAQGINIVPEYVNSHNNVYRNVILGAVSAGGGVNLTFNSESKDVQRELRIIYKLPGVASHPFSSHPRVGDEVREVIINAWIDIAKSEQFKELLEPVHITNPTRADQRRDYHPLKKLKLEAFTQVKPVSSKVK